MLFVIDPQKINLNNKKIILYFYHNKINYHNKFITMIKICEEYNKNVSFLAINVESDKKLTTRFGFKSIPCLIFYKDDIVVFKHEGMLSTKKLKELMRKYYE